MLCAGKQSCRLIGPIAQKEQQGKGAANGHHLPAGYLLLATMCRNFGPIGLSYVKGNKGDKKLFINWIAQSAVLMNNNQFGYEYKK